MTVVVAYKYAANPQDASVGADGVVDWSRAKAAVSEYDPVAVQLARTVAGDSEVVGISVGTAAIASSMAKKSAMSKGLDRGVVVADDATQGWNATQTAAALAGLVGRIDGADLLVTGDSSIDDGARMMSALTAGFLGWPCFQEVTAVEKTADGYALTQAITGGTRTISVTGPVVVAATSDAVPVKVPSMKEILAAGKKPVEVVSVEDVAPVEIGVTVTGRSKPAPKARKNQVFTGESAVADLVAALRTNGIL
ncbi:electron transfer flavoprotein subunit beta/FixA family protein [Changpingibacter yushuensis]|uniref:electron transfer flavoprotein subunit beta/FixA family protein n=1 Tax=Changpingibacter yushuensis TaxID=2758440 RepID=UPI0015F49952|nr:electron transfer flavoprotein beta subunit/FixA family protein [Changpingibacter yushuensis]